MQAESDAFNARSGQSAISGKQNGAAARKAVTAALASDSLGLGVGGIGGTASSSAAASSSATSTPKPSAPKPAARSGMLLPPQLGRRSNVTTEDQASIRAAKRPKPGPSH